MQKAGYQGYCRLRPEPPVQRPWGRTGPRGLEEQRGGPQLEQSEQGGGQGREGLVGLGEDVGFDPEGGSPRGL